MTNVECHLVESDQKKAIFLSTVIRECGLSARVHNDRIELLPCLEADVITARALAPLDRMLPLLKHQLRPRAQLVLEKREHSVEWGQCTRGDDIRFKTWQQLDAVVVDPRRQTAFADHRAKKDGLLLIRFNKMTLDVGHDQRRVSSC